MINFQVHIHGLSGYLAGVSIAVKQVMPDHVLARSVQLENNSLKRWHLKCFRTPLGKITNRHIPLSVFGLTFILWALGAVEGSYCTMFGTGLIVSWVYLRFYQVTLEKCELGIDFEISGAQQRFKGGPGWQLCLLHTFPKCSSAPCCRPIEYHISAPGQVQPILSPVIYCIYAYYQTKNTLKTFICFRCKVCRKPVRRWVPVCWNIFFIHCNRAWVTHVYWFHQSSFYSLLWRYDVGAPTGITIS